MWKIKENSLLAPPWIQKNSFWNYCEVALVKTAPLLPHRQKFLICSANITDEEAVGYISSSSCSHALELSHTYDLVSSLHARNPDQNSWLMSFSFHSHVHLLDCKRAAIKGTQHLPQTKPKIWRSYLFPVIISYHQTRFCSCSSAKGLRSCFTNTSCYLEVFPVGYSQKYTDSTPTLHSDC